MVCLFLKLDSFFQELDRFADVRFRIITDFAFYGQVSGIADVVQCLQIIGEINVAFAQRYFVTGITLGGVKG